MIDDLLPNQWSAALTADRALTLAELIARRYQATNDNSERKKAALEIAVLIGDLAAAWRNHFQHQSN